MWRWWCCTIKSIITHNRKSTGRWSLETISPLQTLYFLLCYNRFVICHFILLTPFFFFRSLFSFCPKELCFVEILASHWIIKMWGFAHHFPKSLSGFRPNDIGLKPDWCERNYTCTRLVPPPLFLYPFYPMAAPLSPLKCLYEEFRRLSGKAKCGGMEDFKGCEEFLESGQGNFSKAMSTPRF